MTAMKEQPSARQIYGTIGPACADVEMHIITILSRTRKTVTKR